MNINKFLELVKSKKKQHQQVFKKLKGTNTKVLDQNFHQAHQEVFTEFNCLECANCCKTTSPRLYPIDIERMAHALQMRPSELMDKYIVMDEDQDYVFHSSPCPFLEQDNTCRIYEFRPKACREYPHTDRKNMIQILDLTYKNIAVCPAVFIMIERIKDKMKL